MAASIEESHADAAGWGSVRAALGLGRRGQPLAGGSSTESIRYTVALVVGMPLQTTLALFT